MGLYGSGPRCINPVHSIYPGMVGKMLGTSALPGTPVVAQNETLPSGEASAPIVVPSQPGFHPSTQRQITWRVFGAGTASTAEPLELQASVDEVATNYVTIDTSIGAASPEIRCVTADISADLGPDLQAVKRIVSSARFFRVFNPNGGVGSPPVGGDFTGTVDICCQ
jgi:hypothetical protein